MEINADFIRDEREFINQNRAKSMASSIFKGKIKELTDNLSQANITVDFQKEARSRTDMVGPNWFLFTICIIDQDGVKSEGESLGKEPVNKYEALLNACSAMIGQD